MALIPALVHVMMKAAEAAGRSLSRDFGEVENLQVSKKGPSDFVSAADQRAEQNIFKSLSKARPDFSFLMEEGGKVSGKNPNQVFIIDPLDGTNNFLHAVPHWCVNIAAQEDGEITAAVTFDVIRNEMFWAAKGKGAFIGNRKLRVSTREDMGMGLVGTGGAPAKGRGDLKQFSADIAKISPEFSGTRIGGSSALDLAYVAAGRLDAYWQRQISPWDVAAGVLLVREAAGIVSEVNGGKDAVYGGSILAGNASAYQDVRRLLN